MVAVKWKIHLSLSFGIETKFIIQELYSAQKRSLT